MQSHIEFIALKENFIAVERGYTAFNEKCIDTENLEIVALANEMLFKTTEIKLGLIEIQTESTKMIKLRQSLEL